MYIHDDPLPKWHKLRWKETLLHTKVAKVQDVRRTVNNGVESCGSHSPSLIQKDIPITALTIPNCTAQHKHTCWLPKSPF